MAQRKGSGRNEIDFDFAGNFMVFVMILCFRSKFVRRAGIQWLLCHVNIMLRREIRILNEFYELSLCKM